DAERTTAPELAHRQRDADAAGEESPRQAEAARDEEKTDTLVARPADPAKQVEGYAEPAVSDQRRQLRDAGGERWPVRARVGEERDPEEPLGDVVPDDPDEPDRLHDVDPREPDRPQRRDRLRGTKCVPFVRRCGFEVHEGKSSG